MGKAYTAAFLLPAPVTKRLTDDGWEFRSTARLPESVLETLCLQFDVIFKENSLGSDVFEGGGLKLIAERDRFGKIENVFVQLRGPKPEQLRAALATAGFANVEVFVPAV